MVLVNNPGSTEQTYAWLVHAKWQGWTFADTIFPAFLWIVGVAITLSTARRVELGESRGDLLFHAARRSAMLYVCGLALEGLPHFDLASWQVTGVLQELRRVPARAGDISVDHVAGSGLRAAHQLRHLPGSDGLLSRARLSVLASGRRNAMLPGTWMDWCSIAILG